MNEELLQMMQQGVTAAHASQQDNQRTGAVFQRFLELRGLDPEGNVHEHAARAIEEVNVLVERLSGRARGLPAVATVTDPDQP